MNKLLIICGPTAVGKTNLGLKLAQKFNGQIISADSRQVYQGMDIGTGKDLPKNAKKHPSGYYLINNIKLWGYDLVKPDQEFSLAHFIIFAQKTITKIQSQNQLPIIVGGTGLYLKAITQSLDTVNIPPSPQLRRQLNKKSVLELQTILKKNNSKRFQVMNHSDQHNPRRLIRAIEISQSAIKPKKSSLNRFDVLWLGLKAPLNVLDQRIKFRVDQRISQGSQQEVVKLINQGYSFKLPSMSAMGYKQWQSFFAGKDDLKKVKETWITAEKQYLRRQLVWFARNPKINWFNITKADYQKHIAKQIKAWYT